MFKSDLKLAVSALFWLSIAPLLWGQASSSQPSSQHSFVPSRITEAVDENKLSVLKGSTHPLARPTFDAGAAPSALRMDRMLLVLRRSPAQEDALKKLLEQQQDRHSPNYHKWLTPEEFGQQFGPSDQDIHTTTQWLQSHGFEVTKVAKGRSVVEFSGTAEQVQGTFHTAIHKYLIKGEEHWANAGDPQIPTALTPVVAGVFTLHNFGRKSHAIFQNKWLKTKYTRGKQPDTTFSDGSHGLSPGDYSVIYNIEPVYTGGNTGGGTIAVVARSDFLLQDVTDFFNVFMGGVGPNVTTVLNGPDPGNLGGGEEVEALLDVTWASSIAPGANVVQVVSSTTNTTDGVDLSALYIIDNNLADIMTESFGLCEAFETNSQLVGDETLSEQAAAQGITWTASTGDSGSAGCDNPNTETVATLGLAVNVPASTPFNVAVGGTQFNENGNDATYWSTKNDANTQASALSYIPEDVWNESCTAAQCGSNANIAAGGGGISTFFSTPSWQSGVPGIPGGGRSIPDVSLTAAGHDFYLLCLEGSCTPDSQGNISLAGVSGTSASTPSFAAILSLVEKHVGSRQGQANYVLYKLAAAEASSPGFAKCNASSTSGLPNSACVFNDVTLSPAPGNLGNAVPGITGYGSTSGKFQTGTAYDSATGLGSVNVANLVGKWNTVVFRPSTVTLGLNPKTGITHGSSVAATVTVARQSGTGTPTGDVSLLTNSPTVNSQGLGFFTLAGGSASGNVNVLPGGSYNVTAHYAGDGTFAPSDSTPVAVTVNPENSATTLSVLTVDANFNFTPFTSGPYGSFVYIRADVEGVSGQGTPTGNIDITDNGGAITGNPYTLNSQGNTATPNGIFTFAPGAHSIVANYTLGDPSFNPSSSAPTLFTIVKATTATSLTNVVSASGDTLSATVNTSSGGNAPTGTIKFASGSTTLAQVAAVGGVNTTTGNAQATATFTTKLTASQSVTATYSGDTNYSSSVSAPVSIAPDFALTPSSPSLNLPPGQGSTITIYLQSLNGFKGTTSFACSGLPAETTCTFNPASFTSDGSGSLVVATKVTITTTAPKTAALSPHERRQSQPLWALSSLGTLAGVFLIGIPNRRRGSRLLGLLALVLLLTLAGCGGSSSGGGGGTTDPGTPAGTSTVTVTGTSGSLSHTATINLTVT